MADLFHLFAKQRAEVEAKARAILADYNRLAAVLDHADRQLAGKVLTVLGLSEEPDFVAMGRRYAFTAKRFRWSNPRGLIRTGAPDLELHRIIADMEMQRAPVDLVAMFLEQAGAQLGRALTRELRPQTETPR